MEKKCASFHVPEKKREVVFETNREVCQVCKYGFLELDAREGCTVCMECGATSSFSVNVVPEYSLRSGQEVKPSKLSKKYSFRDRKPVLSDCIFSELENYSYLENMGVDDLFVLSKMGEEYLESVGRDVVDPTLICALLVYSSMVNAIRSSKINETSVRNRLKNMKQYKYSSDLNVPLKRRGVGRNNPEGEAIFDNLPQRQGPPLPSFFCKMCGEGLFRRIDAVRHCRKRGHA
jgi:hypothetical protein